MIDNKTIQRELTARKLYAGRIDGIIGSGSTSAMLKALAARAKTAGWAADRIRIGFEQLMMTDLGIDAGVIDGVEGVSTQFAWEKWQNMLRSGRVPPYLLPDARPAKQHDWPKERNAAAFYGLPGTNHTRIVPPYQLFYGSDPVKTITLNQKCAESAGRVLAAVLAHYGHDEIIRLKLDQFSGGFNDRVMRGGTRKSMHAYAAALDFGAAWNTLRMNHTQALFARPEYEGWWKAWADEGWTSLGKERDMDFMHVQAADL